MEKLSKIAALQAELKHTKQSIGLVPTMGFLHAGHLSLVKVAREENDIVVVSIFVNPMQFGPEEDLADYPRDFERDCRLLEEAGTDYIFNPTVEEMYPEEVGEVGQKTTEVQPPDYLTNCLCGLARPTHFDGVAEVVAKLFNIVQPERAYFGQKDYQQTVVVRKMTQDLNLPIEIKVCPTVREKDGLAMSSRNIYLEAPERKAATILSRSLKLAEDLFAKGEHEAVILETKVTEMIAREPLVQLEYAEMRDAEDLAKVDRIEKPTVLALAAQVGKARLIDNVLLKP